MTPGFADDQPKAGTDRPEIDRDVQSGELPAASSLSTDGVEASTPLSADPALADSALLAKLENAPQSPVLRRLWTRLLTANPNDGAGLGLTLELLLRGGAVDRVLSIADKLPAKSAKSPGLIVAIAESSLARGRDDAACSMIKGRVGGKAQLAAALEARVLRMTALCAALQGDKGASDKVTVKLAATMLTEKKAGTPPIFAALAALGSDNAPEPWKSGALGVVDVRFLALAGLEIDPAALDNAEPAALATILSTAELNSDTRVAAAELAARFGVIDPASLAGAYAKAEADPSGLANPLASSVDGPAKRSLLSQAVSRATDPGKRAQLIRALVVDARGDGLEAEVAASLAGPTADVPADRSLAWFAETAIETLSVSGRYREAAAWAVQGAAGQADGQGSELLGWLLLINIADPDGDAERGSVMKLAEDLARAGNLSEQLLHRLVTVLDALDYDIPVPLWDAASKTPQPTSGRLPPTGLLTDLQAKSKANAVPETIALTLQAFGAEPADAVNLLTLGDTIRALRAIGLEDEARRLGFEALYPDWPRQGGG